MTRCPAAISCVNCAWEWSRCRRRGSPAVAAPRTKQQRTTRLHPPPRSRTYRIGVDALNARRYETATNQSNLVEQNYPYSSWPANAQSCRATEDLVDNHYTDAIGTLDRFIELHPTHRDVAYAYDLRALCYHLNNCHIQRYENGHAAIRRSARCRMW